MPKQRGIRLNRSVLAYTKQPVTDVHLFIHVRELARELIEEFVGREVIEDRRDSSMSRTILPPPCKCIIF